MSNIFADNPYIRLVEPKPFSPPPLRANELMRADWWSILQDGDLRVLEYIAGEQGGGLKRLVISHDEARRLMNGSLKAEAVLLAHDV